jgi:hypothetical protein
MAQVLVEMWAVSSIATSISCVHLMKWVNAEGASWATALSSWAIVVEILPMLLLAQTCFRLWQSCLEDKAQYLHSSFLHEWCPHFPY